jgi:hypothetical protein
MLLVGLMAQAAVAEERPNEEDLFGGGGETEVAPAAAPGDEPAVEVPSEEAPAAAGRLRERTPPPNLTEERLKDFLKDYLQIGGLLYFRTLTSFREDTNFNDTPFSAPLLSDFYLDARASDRLRGFWSGRLNLDPTQTNADTDFVQNELWIRTDIAKRLFMQLGKQHIKWGTGTIWNPTDFLQPDRLDPLDPFDFRVGVNMVKFHYPVENLGMNFYGFLLTEEADKLNHLGTAFRYEFVLGTGEYGIDFVVPPDGGGPRGGVDFSTGVGPIDLYGEVALLDGHDVKVVKEPSPGMFEVVRAEGLEAHYVGGVKWATRFREEDPFDIGIEYFYNSLGYDDPDRYPTLQQRGLFQTFYVGKQYIGIYAGLEGPWSWNDASFNLFNIANLSDQSFISQLNFAYAIYTNLSLEIQGGVHWGDREGEFRVSQDMDNAEARPIFDLGVRFRMKI